MDIENLIKPQNRLKQGIFFTKHHIVNNITSHFNLTNVKTVIDSAAGSCNFLIPLAIEYPKIKFYGVEKNETIYNAVLDKIKNIPNIFYFKGDILLDNFKIPKCDLYLGNPPFINFSDLDQSYRDLIKPIWLNYFPNSKGFKMLLGDSRGDIAQLIFAYTVNNYLKKTGKIGVILPNSLLKGNSASAGFREFKSIKVEKLIDISDSNPFENTNRNCFYILAQKGGETKFPIQYQVEGLIKNLVMAGDNLVEEGDSLLKNSFYKSRQGINTLGANSIFFFKKEVPFESHLIKPLLKSSDILPFKYKPSYNVLFPYTNGKLISEEDLILKYPMEYAYLLEHKGLLENRKSRFAQKCWYSLFGVGEYTCKHFKVVWRGLGAKELMAAVTINVIPNQAMNCYISTNTLEEAHFICGIMNSTLYKKQLNQLNEEGAKSFAQPNTINKIYIPEYNNKLENHTKISELSNNLHKNFTIMEYEILNNFVTELYKSIGFIS